MVESARGVWLSEGRKKKPKECMMEWYRLQLKERKLHRRRYWKLGMRLQKKKKDGMEIYKYEKERLESIYIRAKKKRR